MPRHRPQSTHAHIHDLGGEGHTTTTEREHDGLFRFYDVGIRDDVDSANT